MLRDAGCAEVLIGFEDTTFSGVTGVEQRGDWKAKRVDTYLEAIRKIQDRGVRVNGCFVLGLDGADLGSFDRIWEFVQESGLYDVQITVQTAFPGTPLYQRLKREGRILHDGAWDFCTLFDVNYQPAQMSVAELEAGLRGLASRIYSEQSTDKRREDFRHNFIAKHHQASH